jgi:hypothetical protein
MAPRHSTLYIGGTGILWLLLAGLLACSRFAVVAALPALSRKAQLVRELELTDLCLFTEASYTRHLAMTDLNTPFQDSPGSFEHFPTGALVAPPPHLVASGAASSLEVRTVAQSPGRLVRSHDQHN